MFIRQDSPRSIIHSLQSDQAAVTPTASSLLVGVRVFRAARPAAAVFGLLQVGLHELERVLARDAVYAADAVAVRHAIHLVRLLYDLRSAGVDRVSVLSEAGLQQDPAVPSAIDVAF